MKIAKGRLSTWIKPLAECRERTRSRGAAMSERGEEKRIETISLRPRLERGEQGARQRLQELHTAGRRSS